jgi:hypothetical protein
VVGGGPGAVAWRGGRCGVAGDVGVATWCSSRSCNVDGLRGDLSGL